MRKITFGGANSLDNFIARKDDRVDWLTWSNDVTEIMTDYWKGIDTMLMGRRTYDVALKMTKGKVAEANPYPGVTSYVFSRTLKPHKEDGLEIVTEDAVSFIRKLKRKPGKDICLMGGGNFAKTLFEAKLIDEIGFNIHPVLLASGIPLFHEMKRQINLELIECRPLKKGCVYLKYRVKR